LRELYTIPELSDMNTTNSAAASSIVISSVSSLPQQEKEENTSLQELPRLPIMTNNQHKHIPISDWPSIIIEEAVEPQFDPNLEGNELACKKVFCHLLESAYTYQQQGQPVKEMHLIFDEKENIRGITMILYDLSRQDYLEFGG
jgi:hypothetical protein